MNASAYLVFRDESRRNEVFRLTSDHETAIGRANSNTLVLKDDRCSRFHAQLFFNEQQDSWFVKDLGSRNGTLVNGRKINPESEFRLSANDILVFGKSKLMFLNELRDLPSDPSSYGLMADEPAQKIRPANVDNSNLLSSSHVLFGNLETAEETIITHKRDKANLLQMLDPEGLVSPAISKKLRRSITNLCRLAIEISRVGEQKVKLELALQFILRELPVNHAAILILPHPTEKKGAAESLQVGASLSSDGADPSYQKVSDKLAQTVLDSRNAVIARHVRGDSILGQRNGDIETTSVICAPIFTDTTRWGVLHVYSTDPRKVPEGQDLDLAIGTAEILSAMFENIQKQNQLTESLTRAQNENEDLRKRLGVQSEIVGTSPAVQEITEKIAMVAGSRTTVLIHGESGVGKELVARAVHFSSPRKKAPFICLNCAVLSEELLASELFGHERGAFTGAVDRKIGKFEAANGGTLMLDEIGEMGLNLQAKFLRVLDGHPFERIGSSKPISVDVRVIAATNRDLEKEVQEGRFRNDLFFRLSVFSFLVPPLRQRVTDIPILAEHFLKRFCAETGRKLQGFSPEAAEKLQAYSWPGNIRELKNVIERAVVLARGAFVEPSDILLSRLAEGMDSAPGLSVPAIAVPQEEFRPMSLEAVELEHIQKTLQFTEGNKSRAAQLLGIERTTLDRKLKKIQG